MSSTNIMHCDYSMTHTAPFGSRLDDPVVVWFIGRGFYGVGDYAPTKNIQTPQFKKFGKPIKRPDRYLPLQHKDALLDLIVVLTQ